MERGLHGVPGLQDIVFEVRREDFAGMWGMVVRASGVDKGTAIEWLALHYGVGLDDVVAVGDWLNDVPMLARAGLSYAMAQAPDEVKSAAKEVLEADIWAGGGVAEAAERAGLI
jgi:hydroxymethylpyrimidine pyrophosphatase-like HAD family hydrolase